jgi:hypothetical protein
MLERPADERKDSVGRSFRRDVGVGVQPVQHAQASKLEVAEDVLGDERRTEQQQQVGRQDRKRDRLAGQGAGGEQRGNVAGAHHERQHLEARRADAKPEPVQRAAQPARPAADASRDIGRGATRGAGHHAKDAHDDAEQAGDADCSQGSRGAQGTVRRGATVNRGRYALHVACARKVFQNELCVWDVHGPSWSPRGVAARTGGTRKTSCGDPAPRTGTYPYVQTILKDLLRASSPSLRAGRSVHRAGKA